MRSLSKSKRFRILRRDGFRCRYCGVVSAVALLAVDHVIPVSRGGTDDDDNLVAACIPCNAGKSDKPLTAPAPALRTIEAMREHVEQVRESLSAQRALDDAKRELVDYLADQWREVVGSDPLRTFYAGLYAAIEKHALGRLVDAIRVVGVSGPRNDVDKVRYFYGVLRRMDTERGASGSALDEMVTQAATERRDILAKVKRLAIERQELRTLHDLMEIDRDRQAAINGRLIACLDALDEHWRELPEFREADDDAEAAE